MGERESSLSPSATSSPAGGARRGVGRRERGPGGEGATSIAITPRDTAALGPELRAFVKSLPTDAARPYEDLLDAFDGGKVEGELLERLGAFLELGLSTGRFKQRLGLNAEDSIRRLFGRTPRGKALNSSADEVTKALQGLAGQTIEELALTLVRPGTYRLVLETDRYRISVGLAPAGAHVESVELTL